MAKQDNPNRIRGTVGGINYFKTRYGYSARDAASVISADRIYNDPAFARTRENMSEFGRAGYSGGLLRKAVAVAMANTKDGSLVSRLTAEMMRVIKSDGINGRGQRTVTDGELGLLRGFEFNGGAPMSSTLKAPYTADINRATGAATVTVPGFVPDLLLVSPPGATHFRFMACAAAINFETGESTTALTGSGSLPLGTAATQPQALEAALPAASTDSLFLLLGVQFFQQVNGIDYALRGGTFNALTIVAVSGS